MTHDPREALDSLLAFRHGDTKHLTAEHARILYEALTASPGEQKPVAWIDFADNGNVRLWTSEQRRADAEMALGRKMTPVYTSPPPAAGWDEAMLQSLLKSKKIMVVCGECADNNPEGCGHFTTDTLREASAGTWVCESCWDERLDAEETRWGDLPRIEALRREAPAPEGVVSVELLNIERATGDRLRSENDKLRATIASLSPSTSRPDAGGGVPDWGQIVQILLRCMDATIKNETPREQAERMANELLEKYPALSAVGDEAKKSEGGSRRDVLERWDEESRRSALAQSEEKK